MTLRGRLSLAAALGVILALSMPVKAQTSVAAAPTAATTVVKPVAAAHPAQTVFATPEEGAAALASAVRTHNPQALVAVVGPTSKDWLFSGDNVADRADADKFLALYEARHSIEKNGDSSAVVTVGTDPWPFPAPLVKTAAGWHFDSEAGRMEILKRRVGRNELDTIQTLLAIVDAQREYVRVDNDKDGFTTYAKLFRSSPGKKDGLYWPAAPNERQSPLGDLIAQATHEGYTHSAGAPSPYHGYLFRMLTAQGPAAHGGAFDYLVRGKLFGGFAVIAWPAKYANSGIMTFIVNHEGTVFQSDLGDDTAARAAKITRFDPDKTWKRAQE